MTRTVLGSPKKAFIDLIDLTSISPEYWQDETADVIWQQQPHRAARGNFHKQAENKDYAHRCLDWRKVPLPGLNSWSPESSIFFGGAVFLQHSAVKTTAYQTTFFQHFSNSRSPLADDFLRLLISISSCLYRGFACQQRETFQGSRWSKLLAVLPT